MPAHGIYCTFAAVQAMSQLGRCQAMREVYCSLQQLPRPLLLPCCCRPCCCYPAAAADSAAAATPLPPPAQSLLRVLSLRCFSARRSSERLASQLGKLSRS